MKGRHDMSRNKKLQIKPYVRVNKVGGVQSMKRLAPGARSPQALCRAFRDPRLGL